MIHNEIAQYITEVNHIYKAGNATEHTYRPALKILLEALMPRHTATNEPKRIACGAPDYIITDRGFAVGYVESKDIPVSLNDKTLKEQFDRYRNSLDNLIITNYLTFRWYAKGELVEEITIGKEVDNKIVPLNDNFSKFTELIRQFTIYHTEGIKTSAELSKQMAAKARLLAEIIENSLNKDIENKEDTELNNQYEGFKSILIDTISTKDFSDLYAQTIAYGMFAARINCSETGDFTREKAAKSIPQTNPFLRKMFGFIAGVDLDSRISWVVDALADLFNYVDIEQIHKEIGRYADNDPIIHFYETFLTDYDKRLKKQRGVWYTPQPVVRFIVNAVNEILKTDFGIAKGLADNSKVTVGDSEYHKVQILDPATGTGTFLAEIVEQIYNNFTSKGVWENYVNEHLIPRLNGFEILMASYAMAHLKLEMLLQETNAEITNNQRIRIYLTDSLDEENDKEKAKEKKTSILKWLTDEANEAANIKRKNPVMVILGNPPYSVSSSNKGKWIQKLIVDYKKDLNERKINLDDDYIKFIRYGQHYVEKNGEGILAYISNNSFIDGVTHRQMRKSLLTTFNKIYILDLHGSSMKKEIAPDGSKDENVFDIQQGVSINIFVKMFSDCHYGLDPQSPLASVLHFDLFGKRQEKYNYLLENDLQTVKWNELQPATPDYFFVPKDFSLKEEYEKGFKIDELFIEIVSGFQTKRDKVTIQFSENELTKIKNIFVNEEVELIRNILQLPEDGRDWSIKDAQKDLKTNSPQMMKVMYRPFDDRYTYFTGKSKGFVAYPRAEMAIHLSRQDNVSLLTCRQQSTFDFQHIFISRLLSDMCNISSQTKETGYIFPLYLYREGDIVDGVRMHDKKIPNLNKTILNELFRHIGLQFSEEKEENENTFAPIDILDYVYAVLYSPTYRERYKEFLKIDFPRVPYPENAEQFWKLVNSGGKLRRLHLLEGVEPQQGMADYPIAGSNEIEKPHFVCHCGLDPQSPSNGKVYINETQYFDNVPLVSWNFYIGGYQPAQKWLKDRKGRTLNYEDIEHYQKIIFVLKETEEVMREVDEVMENLKKII